MRSMIVALVGGAALATAGSLPAAAPPIDLLAPASACPDSVRVSTDAAAQRRAVVCLVNWARARAGRARVSAHPALWRSSKAKADWIVSCGDFSHTPCGRAPASSTTAAGYRFRIWAENLYWGSLSAAAPRSAMQAWLLSPPHRRQLLAPGVRDLGVGRVRAPRFSGAQEVTIWVLHLGRRL